MLDTIKYLETKNEKYPLAFALNVMELIQEKYGSIEKWSELIQKQGELNIKALKFFITEAINEGLDIESEKTGERGGEAVSPNGDAIRPTVVWRKLITPKKQAEF